MMKMLLSVFAAFAALVASVSIFCGSSKVESLEDQLEQSLGKNFERKNIEQIYLAGPDKTIPCSAKA